MLRAHTSLRLVPVEMWGQYITIGITPEATYEDICSGHFVCDSRVEAWICDTLDQERQDAYSRVAHDLLCRGVVKSEKKALPAS